MAANVELGTKVQFFRGEQYLPSTLLDIPAFRRRPYTNMKRYLLKVGHFLLPLFFCARVLAQDVSLQKTDFGYEVRLEGTTFAGYITDFQGAPVIWPIIGPNGERMTRDFPMAERKDGSEMQDHPHHRSLWFTHGKVNDSNFWLLNKQKIVHKKFDKAASDGKQAVLVTTNEWLDQNDEVLCTDERTMRFGMDGTMRYIDFDITVTAVQDDVVFKETKEGTFGVRGEKLEQFFVDGLYPLRSGHGSLRPERADGLQTLGVRRAACHGCAAQSLSGAAACHG